MTSHPPIPVTELADHLERLKANDNLKFSQEYEVSARFPSRVANTASLGLASAKY